MLILDTDLLTLVQREEGSDYETLDQRLEEAAAQFEVVAITILSVEEQARGWLSYIASAKSIGRQIEGYRWLREMLEDFELRQILDFDRIAAEHYQRLVKLKIRIGTIDLKIAAVALANDATLLSRNLRDFEKVPDLRVEHWTKR